MRRRHVLPLEARGPGGNLGNELGDFTVGNAAIAAVQFNGQKSQIPRLVVGVIFLRAKARFSAHRLSAIHSSVHQHQPTVDTIKEESSSSTYLSNASCQIKFDAPMNTTFTGLNYLYSWEKQLPISDGVAYESLLRKYTLDYSVQSLARVDAFLDELRQAKTLHEETYLQESPNQTLFYLLAFYVGEVIGRSLRSEPQWFTNKEANEKFFPDDISDSFFETSLTLHFPDSTTVGVPLFNPLISIVSRAFDEFTTRSVLFSAGALIPTELQKGPASEAPLKPLPARAWPIDVAAWMKNASTLDRSKSAVATPDWADSDDLKVLFSNTEKLIGTGRLVWGALIQANGDLFDPRGLLAGRAAPGEVLYDPAGRASPEALCELAEIVYSLKGIAVQDDACAYIVVVK